MNDVDEKILILAKRYQSASEWLLDEINRLEKENEELRNDLQKWEKFGNQECSPLYNREGTMNDERERRMQ